MNSLGDRIASIRGKNSREKFATMLGVSKTTVVNYEKDSRSPDASFLHKILEVFPETNPAWLLTGDGPRTALSTTNVSSEPIVATSVATPDDHAIFDSLGMVEGMGLLTKIYSAADPVYIRAINANLMAFSDAIESKAMAKDMENRLQELETKLAEMDELKLYVLELKKQEEAREKVRLEEQSSKRKVA